MTDYIVETLFTLLRLGLGFADVHSVDYTLFKRLSKKDWVSLKEESEKQGISILILDGLNEVVNCQKVIYDVDSSWWKVYLLEWMGSLLTIEKANNHQIATMRKMAESWEKSGCRVMVMKGQVNGLMYPNPLHRNPGDIDCYLLGDYALGNDVARLVGAKVDEGWYKHSSILYKGETFENHQFFVHTREGKRSKLLQKELEATLNNVKEWEKFPQSDIVLPPVQWNVMFLTYHACAHFITEGLRLKQIVDWAMFLKTYQDQVDWNRFNDFCVKYHLQIFADAITAICVEMIGLHLSDKQIKYDNAYMDKVLHDVLYNNDYIYSESDGIWKCRWMVVKNLFKYRWKYNEIYQESVWKQLWYYVSGVIFKTEN